MTFKPTSKNLFFSKSDPDDPRLGDRVKGLKSTDEIKKDDFVIFGYPDSTGIQLNGGRLGAEEGPQAIRTHFYKMTPMPFSTPLSLCDLGNLEPSKDIAETHENGRAIVNAALKKGAHFVGLGGGHDFGYCDGAGFLDVYGSTENTKPLIINFDAHLDVRPLNNGLSSGTAFHRLLESDYDFDFLEVGLQAQCNSQVHFEWLLSKGGEALWLEEIYESGQSPLNVVLKFLEPHILKSRPTFISIDIDAFSSAYAPGCSQVYAAGFDPQTVIPVIKILCNRLDVRVFSIYETSPPLDLDGRTSKLAALLLHKFLNAASST